ncbi:glycoside hydrolase family 88 protein [Reichenbachiella sp. MSK19-1]|uniref:glycoside hydrolase family 88 protein n=1 Tax=Reichenbachiella sp. MSK19-1 TaxID=1897631 RepID=UPI000E6B5501|nr:glycoside hydrolase family 88 protein [Reichenbachiella sp. MSK19-1]RJE73044.1 glucuronyl hydrolase [Reichenbachiella sp. MSK19-1]
MIKTRILFVLILAIALGCEENTQQDSKEKDETTNSLIVKPSLSARFHYLLNYEVDSTKFPRSLEENKEVRGVGSSDWTSGFFPGSMIYLYHLTGEKKYLDRAEQWIPFMEREQWNGRTHDMGFKVYSSIGKAYEITQNEHYKAVLIQSAKTLMTRFDPKVGCIKSWDFGQDRWQYPVIIDNMLNLELLFQATRLTGDSSYHQAAVSHATLTMENHFRSDNSSYHVVDYDVETGQPVQKITHQGLNDESVWSRGQGWGLYGFVMAYRYTQNPAFLAQAEQIADYLMTLGNLPEDKIFYWDMKDPSIPDAPRDASAAAVIASALLELDENTTDERYAPFALAILDALDSEAYILPAGLTVPFLLGHSTGNYPKDDEIDQPIAYADYYFLEALYRSMRSGQ